MREQSNKRSGARLKTESETEEQDVFIRPSGKCEARALRATLYRFLYRFSGEKNLTVLQSTIPSYVEALKKIFNGAVSWLASLFSFVKSQLCVLSFFAVEFEK